MRDRLYSTTDLARICGVSISTIKRWTDSGMLRCVRTPGGHRKFRLQDVADAARQLGTSLVDPEGTPGDAARLDELALLLLQRNHQALVARTVESLEVADASGLRHLLMSLHRHGLGLADLGDRILGEALDELRGAAERGQVDDFVLRRGERLADHALRHLIEQIPPAAEGAPTALVAGGPGASDSILPTLAALVLAELGWKVVDLGSPVPLETLQRGLGRERPGMVVLHVAFPSPELETLDAEAAAHGAELVTLPVRNGGERPLELIRRCARERERHLLASVV